MKRNVCALSGRMTAVLMTAALLSAVACLAQPARAAGCLDLFAAESQSAGLTAQELQQAQATALARGKRLVVTALGIIVTNVSPMTMANEAELARIRKEPLILPRSEAYADQRAIRELIEKVMKLPEAGKGGSGTGGTDTGGGLGEHNLVYAHVHAALYVRLLKCLPQLSALERSLLSEIERNLPRELPVEPDGLNFVEAKDNPHLFEGEHSTDPTPVAITGTAVGDPILIALERVYGDGKGGGTNAENLASAVSIILEQLARHASAETRGSVDLAAFRQRIELALSGVSRALVVETESGEKVSLELLDPSGFAAKGDEGNVLPHLTLTHAEGVIDVTEAIVERARNKLKQEIRSLRIMNLNWETSSEPGQIQARGQMELATKEGAYEERYDFILRFQLKDRALSLSFIPQ